MSSAVSSEAAGRKFRRKKLEALENGDGTDFWFQIGQETGQTVHCLKGDLLIASEYFGGLVRSGDPCPVHIKHVQPHIFKMIIRFISVFESDKISKIEDAISLALAADEFLLQPLVEFGCSEIERMVTAKNVWPTLNLICRIPKIAAACSKVLSLNTIKCLQHSTFLEASKDSLNYLLQMEPLKIRSELDLLNGCLKLANSKPEKDGFDLMRAVLPHLRLLTLPTNDPISLLAKYLTAEEKIYLSGQLLFKDENYSGPAPPSLNTNRTPRIESASLDSNILELIPENLVVGGYSESTIKLDTNFGPPKTKFCCEIDVSCDLVLKGVEILTRANPGPDLRSSKNRKVARFEAVDYDEDLSLKVSSSKNGAVSTLLRDKIQGKKQFNSWFYYAFAEDIVIRKGTKCFVQVYPKKEARYLKIADTHRARDTPLTAAKWSVGKFKRCVNGWQECERQNNIIKSVSLLLLIEN